MNLVERIPEYMQICFLFLYNEINQIGYDVLRDKGRNIIPYLKQVVSFSIYFFYIISYNKIDVIYIYIYIYLFNDIFLVDGSIQSVPNRSEVVQDWTQTKF